jgi:hypothetical protein
VGPRTVLDAVVKRNIPSPRRESKPRTPTHSHFNATVFIKCACNSCAILEDQLTVTFASVSHEEKCGVFPSKMEQMQHFKAGEMLCHGK